MSRLPALLFALGLITIPAASAASISSLVVFGDSLSDNGNAAFAFQFLPSLVPAGYPAPAPPLYTAGRYTNGTDVTPSTKFQGVWVEQLAAKLGVADPAPAFPHAFVPTLPNGTNFAVAGAATGTALGDMGFQVSTFLSENPNGISPTALYVLFGGANNLYNSATPTTAAAVALGNIETEIADLYAAGARNFLLPNLPDLGKTPRGASGANAAALSAASLSFDLGWAAFLSAAHAGGVNVTGVDLYSAFQNLQANPGTFAVLNTPAQGLQGINPDQYLFWDAQHPSTAGHAVIADTAFAAINGVSTPEPGSIVLSLAGLGSFGLLLRRKQGNNV